MIIRRPRTRTTACTTDSNSSTSRTRPPALQTRGDREWGERGEANTGDEDDSGDDDRDDGTSRNCKWTTRRLP